VSFTKVFTRLAPAFVALGLMLTALVMIIEVLIRVAPASIAIGMTISALVIITIERRK
jgi:hypothetical protein